MTFEEALKRLAEKEPEKFRIQSFPYQGHTVSAFSYSIHGVSSEAFWDGSGFSQDDIDAILAEIGWEYTLTIFQSGLPHEWAYDLYKARTIYDGDRCEAGSDDELFPTKLEAAKNALIAVVEREYPL